MDEQEVAVELVISEQRSDEWSPSLNADELPSHWQTTRLANEQVFAFENGIWTGTKLPLVDCPVIRNTNFANDGSLDLSDVAVIPIEQRYLEKKQLKWGDIIIERSGGGPNQPVGRVVFFSLSEGKFCFSNFTSRLRVIDGTAVDPKFLHLYLLYFHWSGRTEMLQRRTTGIRNLAFEDYKNTTIPLPPLSEQRAIVHTLCTMQEAILTRRREADLERDRKAALMQHLFTYGIRGEATKLIEIGEMPESWRVVQMGSVARIERGKFTHRPRNDPAFYGGAIPFIQTGDVTASDGHIRTYSQTLNEQGLSVSKIFPKGTIVITIAANIGYTGILEFDSAFPDSLIGITPREGVDTEYLHYYLTTQQPEMDRRAPQGTQKNINIEFLSPWPVIIPSLTEQREIGAILRACDTKISTLEQETLLLDELFSALLEELMTGRLSTVPLMAVEVAHE